MWGDYFDYRRRWKKHSTLLYDIVLDDEVPEDYYIDFEIPEA